MYVHRYVYNKCLFILESIPRFITQCFILESNPWFSIECSFIFILENNMSYYTLQFHCIKATDKISNYRNCLRHVVVS